ncbi:hypothetical protein THAOC_10615 [Thalassiosira oceanica]|uniref:Uncharacterized protein n=1 Tax=Thalassiosira oceanica TaxID=159749 RepID=K0SPM2_THAOC|nr:hypothetical protein THAOC_10615 [Thalassiosira oceanica]|eukprot:EJK68228.1 hypothetical protein THAOC_10615 [Thalassiosira oceanica]
MRVLTYVVRHSPRRPIVDEVEQRPGRRRGRSGAWNFFSSYPTASKSPSSAISTAISIDFGVPPGQPGFLLYTTKIFWAPTTRRPGNDGNRNGPNERSTEGEVTLWTTPTCPSLTRRHPKTLANSTLGTSTAPTDYSSQSPSDPTATSARSSATSFLAKGPASPCPRSRTDRKPTSPTCAPPRTPPPSMSSPQHAPTGNATSPDISLAILTRHPPHVNISSRNLGSTPQKPSPSCSTTHSSTSSAPRPASRPPIGPRPGPTTAPHTFSQILP